MVVILVIKTKISGYFGPSDILPEKYCIAGICYKFDGRGGKKEESFTVCN